MSWTPSLGVWQEAGGTRVRVWAPAVNRVELAVEGGARYALDRTADGYHEAAIASLPAGTRYRYRLDGDVLLPDPASRSQPDGVHRPSAVVDASAFGWHTAAWAPPDPDRIVLYELHVGTFSPEGTFAGAAARLDHLLDLGVTAVELMPVADFPGTRNWGYDGVSLFAPARCYGTPDDLRRLVDRAHSLGLWVVLDVVYNHLGPDGNYLRAFAPQYFTGRHQTPWGEAINLDQPESEHVRRFLIENACHWVNEYRIDGLRLDATHALVDDSPRHLLEELTDVVRASVAPRAVWISAEDHRNLATMLRARDEGGWGLDAVWADDLHHQLRRATAGDSEGYYADFSGTAVDIATTIRQGWFYTGQPTVRDGEPRGTDPAGLAPRAFVVCLQNHDQVGNRALGERLHHQIEPAVWRALSALLLFVPETPLIFMGQEWAASSPFLYFTDHNPELGRLVTEGRRREFRHFSAFSSPEAAARIPDPQARTTFERSRLDWNETGADEHATVLDLYRRWLGVRKALQPSPTAIALALNEDTIAVRRRRENGDTIWLVVRLRGAGDVALPEEVFAGVVWRAELDTDADGEGPMLADLLTVRFRGPGAVLLSPV
jgi:maltooligosyltrehalose trehalohydrolase